MKWSRELKKHATRRLSKESVNNTIDGLVEGSSVGPLVSGDWDGEDVTGAFDGNNVEKTGPADG